MGKKLLRIKKVHQVPLREWLVTARLLSLVETKLKIKIEATQIAE